MARADDAAGPAHRRPAHRPFLRHAARGARPIEAMLLSRTGVVSACAVLVLLLGLNALVFFHATQALVGQDRAVAHTQDVLAAINASQDTLTAAENGQRGFILYGDAADLQDYEAAARLVSVRLARLRALVADNAAEARRAAALGPIADAKLAALEQTIALQRLGQSAQAEDIVVRDRGQRLTATLQSRFDAMTRTELALLHQRAAQANAAATTATLTLILSTAVDAGLLAGVLLTLQRLLARRARLADERGRLLLEAQQARTASEAALKVRNDFLLVAAHDLRTPLTTMLGHTQLVAAYLRDGRPLEPAWLTAQMEAFVAATKRLIATVNELNDMVTLEHHEQLELSLAPVDLVALARAVAAEMAPRLSAQGLALVPITIAAPPDPLVIRADRDRLARVLQNVVGNAVKYSVNETPVRVEVRREHTRAVVAVHDEGVGIPADELPRIFERFYRASTARGITGSGIGLAGAKATVEQHGGTIAVASVAGAGTTVTIALPLVEASAEAEAGVAAQRGHSPC